MPTHILAIDQGTTGTTVLCLHTDGAVVGKTYRPHAQHYPQPGWVEHDPVEIALNVEDAAAEALATAGIAASDLAAVGLTNQRETVLVWDAQTGLPVGPAIVWQCRRTAEECIRLREEGWESAIRQRTGLLLDPYFSAAKIAWLLDQDPQWREEAEAGKLLAGTIDSWLAWRMSGGTTHVTDVTNASRTSLMNLSTFDWDPELLQLFRVPRECMPQIVPSCGSIAPITKGVLKGAALTGMAGDQQAALFGHRCCRPGEAKNTYGTGCFLLLHTGPSLQIRQDSILTTVACGPSGEPQYAWEGSVFMAGAVVQWLRDELGIIGTSAEIEELARGASDSGGVVFVPAFTGLGAPYWDSQARGAILGLTRGTGRSHLARAALESMALQTVDLVTAMEAEMPLGQSLPVLNVDGGATANRLLMQIQADLLDRPILRARQQETTALGAAYLAGVGAGIWPSVDAIPPGPPPERIEPSMDESERQFVLQRWERAVRAVRNFGAR
ncbi:MAG: glycerol kinase GlpK [Armatimonadota bacterium]|nr:glycerol kinase GlpK [Armatimonadota bacterium]